MNIIEEISITLPGSGVRPEINADGAKDILQRIYGIKALEIRELIAYDDRNFFVLADKNVENPYTKYCPHGYILRIMNPLDSKKIGFFEGQTQLSIYLNNQKIVCPRQLQDVNGKYYTFENDNMVRLAEFIPGKLLGDIPSPQLYYQAGVLLGKLDAILKNFSHDGYKTQKTLWMLSSVPILKEFLQVVVDEKKRKMVENTIQEFKHRVLNHIDLFPKQMIHGDFNANNILVDKNAATGEYEVSGVIDFGDSQISCILFELAIGIAHMMLIDGNVKSGGYFLGGFKKVLSIPAAEMKLLKICVCARLCQSLVIGLYTHQFDKDNKYLLSTQETGWKLFYDIYPRSDEEVCEIWNKVADEYSFH